MGVIYVRPNLINGKKYVGQATNLEVRQKTWNNLNQSYAGPAINAARAKYGIDNFGFEILKECNDDELDYWEKYYVKELNTKAPYGYNLTDGGGGMSGYTLSEETRIKMSECNKGKHLSEETKRKISEGHKGKKFSEETRKKISDVQKGRKHTDEQKRKIAEAHRGKKNYMYGKHHTEETKRKISDANKNGKCSKLVLQINKDTNEVIAEFPSMNEVERQLGISKSNVSKCCQNKPHYNTAYGYKWQYK